MRALLPTQAVGARDRRGGVTCHHDRGAFSQCVQGMAPTEVRTWSSVGWQPRCRLCPGESESWGRNKGEGNCDLVIDSATYVRSRSAWESPGQWSWVSDTVIQAQPWEPRQVSHEPAVCVPSCVKWRF